ncbi:MAG: FCD domain-containing protein, partial [Thermodesulfovibrionales bacterium]
AAYTAAKRGTPSDMENLRKIIEKEEENLKNNREDARTDADFHVAIALVTHNTVFSHLMASWYHLLWNTQQVAREKIFRKKGNRAIIADQHRRLFEEGEYVPLDAAGQRRMHLCAFARRLGDLLAVSVVPRLLTSLLRDGAQIPVGPAVWKDTSVMLPPSSRPDHFVNVFTGEKIRLSDRNGGGVLPVSKLLSVFPVALLIGIPAGQT